MAQAPSSPHDTLSEVTAALERIPSADAATVQDLRTRLLGRKAGALTLVLRTLGKLDPDDRRAVGQRANQLKQQVEEALAAREKQLAAAADRPADYDGTMPGRRTWRGVPHPTLAVVDEICEIFREIGFTRVVGPQAETEDYNFTKLNMPLTHPAADEHDTFYLGPGVLLRSHTSTVQARVMERFQPPIRIVVPGLVYRRDPFDPSHSPVFEQIEGLAVDEGISFVDFKAAIDYFVKRFFTKDTVVRLRPSFFPFTEPSAEVDVQCQVCRGSGCTTCKQTGFLEIMGAGMVDPAVFENCGIDAERYTGYAFGMGPDRITMLRHGIPDIRLLFENDVRFLSQFGAAL
jgi:phenylalanyl-tRNA synthetase alpha chain